MRRGSILLPLGAAVLVACVAGCSQTSPFAREGHGASREDVARDVQAILDGMAAARRDDLSWVQPPRRTFRPDSEN